MTPQEQANSTKYFRTDGVRGEVDTYLGPELATAIGRAAAELASKESKPARMLVVRDTRESGPMLEAALASGFTVVGGDVVLAGVLPTPAASLLVRQYGFDLGAVISASHNPYTDNGIKFFNSDGHKLTDEQEREIESRLTSGPRNSSSCGGISRLEGATDDYMRLLASSFQPDLSGSRILLDCAHGATYLVAPRVFERLGAEVEVRAAEPDGRNINEGVGSTHVDSMAAKVAEGSYDIGFAFDGDGDRVLAVNGQGEVFDGDELVALAALYLRDRGNLSGKGVAVTIMSNFGFHRAMEEEGLKVATTGVGDRCVSEELKERGWVLGGEQSGHLINYNFSPTGDGIATALLTMEALSALDRELGVDPVVKKLPQALENVPVANRDGLEGNDPIREEVERGRQGLDGRGRIVVRASGTEQVIRVMVEAPSEDECNASCERLSAVIREQLGKK